MIRVHPQADIPQEAQLGDGSMICGNPQIREQAQLRQHRIVGRNAYIDIAVVIIVLARVLCPCSHA